MLKIAIISDFMVPEWFPDFLWRYKTIRADIRKPYYLRAKALAGLVLLLLREYDLKSKIHICDIMCVLSKFENLKLCKGETHGV